MSVSRSKPADMGCYFFQPARFSDCIVADEYFYIDSHFSLLRSYFFDSHALYLGKVCTTTADAGFVG